MIGIGGAIGGMGGMAHRTELESRKEEYSEKYSSVLEVARHTLAGSSATPAT